MIMPNDTTVNASVILWAVSSDTYHAECRKLVTDAQESNGAREVVGWFICDTPPVETGPHKRINLRTYIPELGGIATKTAALEQPDGKLRVEFKSAGPVARLAMSAAT